MYVNFIGFLYKSGFFGKIGPNRDFRIQHNILYLKKSIFEFFEKSIFEFFDKSIFDFF